ncbi:MAG: hypothetical protein EPN49_01555 [Rhodanobacter sp.]|nr:MAG: hypothetical protein EPN49_01555 [Rhodanobacter sp.]
MFFAMAVAMGLAVASPTLAATTHKQSEVKALHALIDKQQQQLDQQQQELQALRDSLQRLEGEQVQQHAELAKVAAAPPPPAHPAEPAFSSAPGVSVSLNGFVSATAFSQSKSFVFGNGQNAEFPVPGSKGRLSGFDVRNTRFWLDFKGSKFTDNWSGSGHLEMDFFGGFNGTGAYSQQQPIPRLRQAYMDLNNVQTGSTVRIGQQWDLMFPLDNVTTSLSHIAFPLGLGVGMIGWRFPGAVWMQDLNHGSSGPKWRLDLGAFEGSWSGPGDNVNYLTAGNPGFRPQLEARLHVQDKSWLAYAVVHYSKIDLKGVGGTAATPIKSSIDSEGFELGGNWNPGPWMFKANAYTGKGLGEIFGDLVQFGDISETGGYLQAGYKFTPNWSTNVFYAYSKSDRSDVVRWLGNGSAGRLKNRQSAVSLLYSAGAYDFGLEWIYDKLDTTDGLTTKTTSGNEVNLSALYHF